MLTRPVRRYWTTALVLLGLCAAAVAAQQRAPQAEPDPQEPDAPADTVIDTEAGPLFRAGIDFVNVDVIVTDGDGNHVSDLTAGDFEILEEGEPQTLASFERIAISAVPEPGAEPARRVRTRNDVEREAGRTDVRLIVLFFDDYHVRFGNGARASLHVDDFLERHLLPTDLVATMHPLTPLSDVYFTRNHDLIREQVRNWRGRKYDYVPQNEFEVRYAYYPTETVVLIRNQVTLSALHALMVHLGGIRESRKTVLLVSEGYTNYVPPQLRQLSAADLPSSFTDPSAGLSAFEQTQQIFVDAQILHDLERVFSMANRFNTSIYPLDPRGLAASEYDLSQPAVNIRVDSRMLQQTQGTLRRIALETDGRAIVNQNDFEPGLEQMLQDASAYYLLGYESTRRPRDGEFHRIQIRVLREGVRVRHRRGYWAVTERDVQRALAGPVNEPPKAVDTALSVLAAPRRRHLVNTWVGTARGDNGRTRVTFVWEPTRGEVARPTEDPARVLLMAMSDAAGGVFRGRVPEPAGGAARGLAGGPGATAPVRGSTTFETDPGKLQLSMAVEGASGEVLDRDRREIDVPDFTRSELVLSTPAFIRARNHREWQQFLDDWDAVPTSSREFRRTERLLLRFEAYAAGPARPDVVAYLLNRRGDRMYPLVVQPGENGRPYQVDIQPVALAPGDYVVELTVTTAADELTRLVAFRLTS